MGSNHIEKDEPLTPAGRLFLRPEMNQIISCIIVGKHPFDADAIKAVIINSAMVQHPRFTSLLVKDSSGREHWRKTKVNVDEHLIIRHEPLTEDDPSISNEDAVNDYLANLAVSCPLSTDKPLWEVHLLVAQKCIVGRFHHALGDGISLMAMFLGMCRRADDPTKPPTINGVGSSASNSALKRRRWSFGIATKTLWYTMVFLVEFMLRSLWLKDKKTAVSGGAGVELWPRKLATARFRLDDMKMVKRAIADAVRPSMTFFLELCHMGYPSTLISGHQKLCKRVFRAMVNLRPQTGWQNLSELMESEFQSQWGNKFGMILLPLSYHKGVDDPLRYLKGAKAMLDKKKLSLESICSYKIGDFVMSYFGAKLASLLNYRIVCNTTFTISNIIGPQEEVTMGGNSLEYIRVTSTSLPHAITMHMLSYAGRADLQILVAKDIIPDPKLLAKCFEDALLEMKGAAMTACIHRRNVYSRE